MLSLILGFFTGLAGPISAVFTSITTLQTAKLKAATDSDKIKIDQQIEEAHDRKAVLVAEAGSRISSAINAIVRIVLTAGPAAFLLKVFLWDKVIGAFAGCANYKEVINAKTHLPVSGYCNRFTTDAIDPNLWKVAAAVIAFYFVYDIFANSRK